MLVPRSLARYMHVPAGITASGTSPLRTEQPSSAQVAAPPVSAPCASPWRCRRRWARPALTTTLLARLLSAAQAHQAPPRRPPRPPLRSLRVPCMRIGRGPRQGEGSRRSAPSGLCVRRSRCRGVARCLLRSAPPALTRAAGAPCMRSCWRRGWSSALPRSPWTRGLTRAARKVSRGCPALSL